MTARAHAFLPPSGAKAWSKCSMWPTMNQLFPQDDSEDAREGNAAHWVAWQLIQNGWLPDVGFMTPENMPVTDEMQEGALFFVERLKPYMEHAAQFQIEQWQPIGWISEHCAGTPDLWFYDQTNGVLHVFDYKFGHRFVDEFENLQGVCYEIGILDKLANTFRKPVGLIDDLITCHFHVIQPRCFYKGEPHRTWVHKASDLRSIGNMLIAAGERAISNPVATTNEECRDCPGRHACTALQQAAYSDAEFACASSPLELDITQASRELRMLQRALARLNARVDGLAESVKSQMLNGKQAPFHQIGFGRASRVWKLPNEEVLAIGQLFGKDFSKKSVLTPKQVIDLHTIDEAVISEYTERKSGVARLEPVDNNQARKVFG